MDVVTQAVAYPHNNSADAVVAAVLATRAAEDGRLTVVRAERLRAKNITEPIPPVPTPPAPHEQDDPFNPEG